MSLKIKSQKLTKRELHLLTRALSLTHHCNPIFAKTFIDTILYPNHQTPPPDPILNSDLSPTLKPSLNPQTADFGSKHKNTHARTLTNMTPLTVTREALSSNYVTVLF